MQITFAGIVELDDVLIVRPLNAESEVVGRTCH